MLYHFLAVLFALLCASPLRGQESATPMLYRRIDIPAELLTGANVDGASLQFAGDVRLGELNGGGEPEFIVVRDSDAGTKVCFLGALTSDGKLLWKLGKGGEPPARAGSVAVHDLDGDGQDEIICLCATPKIESAAAAMTNARLQIRSGASGKLLKQAAPPELTSCVSEEPDWILHPSWVHQRILPANLRGNKTPRDLVLKLGAAVLAFDENLKVLWKHEIKENARPYHAAFVPAIGDMDGDGKDEVYCGQFLLGPDGSVKWQQKLAPHVDAVAIAPWDQGRVRAIASTGGQVLDLAGETVLTVGRRQIPHGKELRIAELAADSVGPEMVVRSEGDKPDVIVASVEGSVLRRFKLNQTPSESGLETVRWNGPTAPAVLYNGGMLWEGTGKLIAALPDLEPPVGPAAQGWYHCLPSNVCGDNREEAIVFNPWDKRIWIYTPGAAAAPEATADEPPTGEAAKPAEPVPTVPVPAVP